jgi:hypothetical protein
MKIKPLEWSREHTLGRGRRVEISIEARTSVGDYKISWFGGEQPRYFEVDLPFREAERLKTPSSWAESLDEAKELASKHYETDILACIEQPVTTE